MDVGAAKGRQNECKCENKTSRERSFCRGFLHANRFLQVYYTRSFFSFKMPKDLRKFCGTASAFETFLAIMWESEQRENVEGLVGEGTT